MITLDTKNNVVEIHTDDKRYCFRFSGQSILQWVGVVERGRTTVYVRKDYLMRATRTGSGLFTYFRSFKRENITIEAMDHSKLTELVYRAMGECVSDKIDSDLLE